MSDELNASKFSGFVCDDCGFISDKEVDWVITDDDVFCSKCGSAIVSPVNILRGVMLR